MRVPFDLKKYNEMKEKVKVFTRRGDEVTLITLEGRGQNRLVGYSSPASTIIRSWKADGRVFSSPAEHPHDLFMELPYEPTDEEVFAFALKHDFYAGEHFFSTPDRFVANYDASTRVIRAALLRIHELEEQLKTK